MELLLGMAVGLVIGVALTWAWWSQVHRARTAALSTERDLLRERLTDLESSVDSDIQTASLLVPLREALGRVEHQMGTFERDRVQQYSALTTRIGEVQRSAQELHHQSAALSTAMNSSTSRGHWGEVQLRRILEHSGMLPRCDFDEQVSAVSRHQSTVRPDVVVHLPGGKTLVIDAKAPMSAFLAAQELTGDPAAHQQQLAAHAKHLLGHVSTLAAKEYWSAFSTSPEMVICFVPADAVLAAALQSDTTLLDRALARSVVLASPSTLLALLRTVAFTWQQDALTANARTLFELGRELYARLATLGTHTSQLGTSLRRSVESYNALVGSLESRVLVSARRMSELNLTQEPLAQPAPLEAAPRPLTAVELIDAVTAPDQRDQLDFGVSHEEAAARPGGAPGTGRSA